MMTGSCGKILASFDDSQPLTPKNTATDHHTVSTEKMSGTDALLIETHKNTSWSVCRHTEQWGQLSLFCSAKQQVG